MLTQRPRIEMNNRELKKYYAKKHNDNYLESKKPKPIKIKTKTKNKRATMAYMAMLASSGYSLQNGV